MVFEEVRVHLDSWLMFRFQAFDSSLHVLNVWCRVLRVLGLVYWGRAQERKSGIGACHARVWPRWTYESF